MILTYCQVPIDPSTRYTALHTQYLNDVLLQYQRELTSVHMNSYAQDQDVQLRTSFLIPIGPVCCIESVARLCKGEQRLLVLASDKVCVH